MKKVKKNYEKIIKDLESEIVRKQEHIDKLKVENIILLKTALKRARKK